MTTKFPSHIHLSRETRSQLVEMLNSCLATAVDLHWQVKQAHWNIRGTHFLSRHLLFDQVAKHVYEQADEFAERAGALGGYAEGTIRLATRNTELEEYDLSAVDGEQHIRVVVERVARYAATVREGIQRSDDLKDPVTTDLLTKVLGAVEQDLWFLESHMYGASAAYREETAPSDIREEGLSPSDA